MRYVIKREDRPGLMLMGMGIGCNNNAYIHNTEWCKLTRLAVQFNEDEAQATIDFITNVIDWELGEQLYIEPVNEEGREQP